MKYEKERCELIECARAMEHYGLVMLSGGNVSLRMKDGTFLVTPSAMAYDSMIPEDIVLVNGKGETIEGKRGRQVIWKQSCISLKRCRM